MTLKCADVFMNAVLCFCIFYIKKESFLKPDGVSITLNEIDVFDDNLETFIYSSLWIHKRFNNKATLSYKGFLQLLLILSGDIELNPGPNTNYSDLINFTKHKGFVVLHQNIRGLQGGKDLIADVLFHNKKIDIFSLSETFLRNNVIFDTEIRGYDFEYKCRSERKGGGVGAYIKHGVPYKRRNDLEVDKVEIMWLEISFKNTKPFLIGILYRPPDSSNYSNTNFPTSLKEILQTASHENKEITIMGDVNCDYFVKDDHKEVKHIFTAFGLKQLVTKPTRITENSSTLIDVVLTNTPENISQCDTLLSSLSDHEMIGFIRKKVVTKYAPKRITSRNYKNYNPEIIQTEFNSVDWTPPMECNDSNKCWDLLSQTLRSCINKHAPFTTKAVKGKPCPWLTQPIKNEMNFRDNLLRKARKSKKESDWLTYKKKKNHVNNLIKVAKAEHNKLLLEENISKPDKFWKFIKNLFPTKPKKEISSTKFIINEKTTSNEYDIANGFCSFFQSTVSTLKANSIKLKNFTWSKPTKHQTNYAKCFNFRHVSVPVVS